jgi:hypothetical protein
MAKRKGKAPKGASTSRLARNERARARRAETKAAEARAALARSEAAKKAARTHKKKARAAAKEAARRLELEARRKREEAARTGHRRKRIREQAENALAAMMQAKAENAGEDVFGEIRPIWRQAKWDVFEAYGGDRERYLQILEDIADACDSDWDIFYGPEGG